MFSFTSNDWFWILFWAVILGLSAEMLSGCMTQQDVRCMLVEQCTHEIIITQERTSEQ